MTIDLKTLGLSDRLIRGMNHAGMRSPNPFQAELLRHAVEGRNVLALTRPGQEVIGAVVLPALQQCTVGEEGHANRSPRVLILTSSRDRARTLQRGALAYGRFLSLRAVALYSGVTVESQIPLLQQGAEIVIATPERLLEHLQHGSVQLGSLRFLIFDEGERLIEGGISASFEEIQKGIPEGRLAFLYAGRSSDELSEFAARILPNAVEARQEGVESDEVSASASERGALRGRPRAGERTRHGSGVRQRDSAGGGKPGRVSGHPRTTGPTRHTGTAGHAGPKRHAGPAGQSGLTRHSGPTKHTSPQGRFGSAGHFGGSGGSASSRHAGPPRQSGPGRPGGMAKHPQKGVKKLRRHPGSTLTAPRKKRPPKKLDSFSSDSGGAGWS